MSIVDANMSAEIAHRKIFTLAWPMILSNISIPLLGIVDTAILGHLDEAKFLAAVAAGSTILTFLLWGFGFLRMGTTSLVARALGRKDDAACHELLRQNLRLATVLSLLLIAIQYPIFSLAIEWLKPREAVAELATRYCHIRILSAPATLANYAIAGWFIGMQNTRAPLLIVLVTNLLNIILDWLLIVVFGLQSDGAATATVISDYAGLVLALILTRCHVRKLTVRQLKAQRLGKNTAVQQHPRPSYRELLQINSPLFVRTICLLFSFAFFTAQGARMGDSVLAANAIMMQLLLLTSHGLDGFAHATEALVGRAVGARRIEEFLTVCKASTLWSIFVAVLFTFFFALFKGALIAGFSDINTVTEMIFEHYAWLYLLPLISVWSYLFDGIFIGTAKTQSMQNTMLLSCFGIFIPAWWFTQHWGNHGLWFAFTCFNACRGISLGLIFTRNTLHKLWF